MAIVLVACGQTKRNYTGQRLDDTGLLYYNARYYDPNIGRFVSADTISLEREDPQSRNRYSYVLNNPLKYTDPSGHCAESYATTTPGCEQYLNDHGWSLNINDWAYERLKLFVDSVFELKTALGWSRSDYKDTMTGGNKYSLQLVMDNISSDDLNRTADTRLRDGALIVTIYRKNAFFNGAGNAKDPTTIKGTFVHEQGHVWDISSGGAMSRGLAGAVDGHYVLNTGTGQKEYVTSDIKPTSAGSSPGEDWPETVMALTYPGHSRSGGPVSNWSDKRKNYIRSVAPSAVVP